MDRDFVDVYPLSIKNDKYFGKPVVVVCPYCGEKHYHGIPKHNPPTIIRASDCNRGEYRILLRG